MRRQIDHNWAYCDAHSTGQKEIATFHTRKSRAVHWLALHAEITHLTLTLDENNTQNGHFSQLCQNQLTYSGIEDFRDISVVITLLSYLLF